MHVHFFSTLSSQCWLLKSIMRISLTQHTPIDTQTIPFNSLHLTCMQHLNWNSLSWLLFFCVCALPSSFMRICAHRQYAKLHNGLTHFMRSCHIELIAYSQVIHCIWVPCCSVRHAERSANKRERKKETKSIKADSAFSSEILIFP